MTGPAPILRVLSLGAGVQSTTLALMAAHGAIERPDVAIFADTQWEPRAVYEHLHWLMSPNVLPFPVRIVTVGSLRENVLTRRNSSGGRFVAVPWFTIGKDGKKGRGRRQCTREYKLDPMAREIRKLLGKGPRERIRRHAVKVMIGISRDEAHRAKPARVQYMKNEHPLLDLGMTRRDCYKWLRDHDYPVVEVWEATTVKAPWPPKSACVACPFTDDERWRDRKIRTPEEWQDAVFIDQQLRLGDARGMHATEFVHDSRVPLDQAPLDHDERQPDLFGEECEGMCGV